MTVRIRKVKASKKSGKAMFMAHSVMPKVPASARPRTK